MFVFSSSCLGRGPLIASFLSRKRCMLSYRLRWHRDIMGVRLCFISINIFLCISRAVIVAFTAITVVVSMAHGSLLCSSCTVDTFAYEMNESYLTSI